MSQLYHAVLTIGEAGALIQENARIGNADSQGTGRLIPSTSKKISVSLTFAIIATPFTRRVVHCPAFGVAGRNRYGDNRAGRADQLQAVIPLRLL